ncbi:MAG: hypothetical protein U1F36_05225 [Planctomycetota bacterium]
MQPARPATLAAVVLFAATPTLSAQRTGPDPVALAQEAERLLQGGHREDATLLLWRARAALDAIEDRDRRELTRTGIANLLARADPLVNRHAERDKADAKDTVEFARACLRRNLPQRALALLEDALPLDRATVEPVLGYAQKQIASRRPAKPATRPKEVDPPAKDAEPPLADRMPEFVPRVSYGAWDIQKFEVRSPRLDGDTAYLVGKAPTHEDGRISVDMLIGDVDGSAALMFGGIDASTYYIVELLHQTDDGTGRYSNLSIHRIAENKAIELARASFNLTPQQRAGWLTVTIEIRGRALSAGLGDRSSLRCSAPTDPYGGVGFFVTGNSPNTAPVRFRRLLLRPLPPDAPPGSGADTRDTPAEAPATSGDADVDPVRAALDAIPGIDLDHDLMTLDSLWARLDDVADDRTRTALAIRLAQAVADLDPLAKAGQSLRTARAGRRVDEAHAYFEQKLPRLAAFTLHEATRFDPEAGAELRAEVAKALAPPPTEPLPVATDCDVLAWFDGGETLLGDAGWVLGPKGARAPSGSGEQIFAGKRAAPKHGKVRADLVLSDTADARVGVAFDVRSAHDLAIAIVDRVRDRIRLSVVRYYAGNYTLSDTRLGPAAKQGEAAACHLEIEFDGDTARVLLRGAEPLSVQLADRAATPRLGLFAAGSGEPPEFLNFRVEPAATGR